jgi:hypothetical protein
MIASLLHIFSQTWENMCGKAGKCSFWLLVMSGAESPRKPKLEQIHRFEVGYQLLREFVDGMLENCYC